MNAEFEKALEELRQKEGNDSPVFRAFNLLLKLLNDTLLVGTASFKVWTNPPYTPGNQPTG